MFLKCKFFYGNNSQDYFLRLRYHHHNLLALSLEEKAALVPSFEGQLVPLAQHIVQLRRKPEFTAINQIADHLLQPAWSNKRKRCADLQEEQVDCYKYICCFSTFYQVVKDLQEVGESGKRSGKVGESEKWWEVGRKR